MWYPGEIYVTLYWLKLSFLSIPQELAKLAGTIYLPESALSTPPYLANYLFKW